MDKFDIRIWITSTILCIVLVSAFAVMSLISGRISILGNILWGLSILFGIVGILANRHVHKRLG